MTSPGIPVSSFAEFLMAVLVVSTAVAVGARTVPALLRSWSVQSATLAGFAAEAAFRLGGGAGWWLLAALLSVQTIALPGLWIRVERATAPSRSRGPLLAPSLSLGIAGLLAAVASLVLARIGPPSLPGEPAGLLAAGFSLALIGLLLAARQPRPVAQPAGIGVIVNGTILAGIATGMSPFLLAATSVASGIVLLLLTPGALSARRGT